MIKVLIVGDTHVVPDELDDCSNLLGLILKICASEKIKEVWFTGDQHHTQALVRLEVQNWWRAAFRALRNEGIKSVCLVGNHDQAWPGSNIHSMTSYEGLNGVTVIDKPTVHHGVLMVPYFHDQKEFLEAVNRFTVTAKDFVDCPPTLFCHQTFDGSTYENGFPASDGFNLNLIRQELIISGHIHTGQEFGKVWYVGAPRWRSLSDANVDRSLWVVEFQDGKLVNRQPYSTGDVCRQIRSLDDTVKNPVPLPLDPKHQWRIDIKGSPEWCQDRKKVLTASGARVRTFPDQVSTEGRIKESDGISKAFQKYLALYQPKHGTPIHVLEQIAKERLSV